MPSSFTSSLRLVKQAAGENNTTWGTIFNNQFSDLIDSAIAGYLTVAVADANKTLTTSNGSPDESRAAVLQFTGALTANRTITIPAVSKIYFLRNTTTGGFELVIKTAAGVAITIPAAASVVAVCDGTDTFALTSPTSNTSSGGGILPSGTTINNFTVGYLEIPQNLQSADYTLVSADSGKHIYHPSSDTTARRWTIPSNASVPFPIGTALTFINGQVAGDVVLGITADTLIFAGTGSTGDRLFSGPSSATAVKITATSWIISGTGIA
jgi:hypothetical protein